MSEPRVSGKYTLQIEIYFTVETDLWLIDLVNIDREEFKKENVWIEKKRTGNEHTNKVGFLTGPIVENANLNYYDMMMKYLGKVENREVEVKRNMVYEGKEKE